VMLTCRNGLEFVGSGVKPYTVLELLSARADCNKVSIVDENSIKLARNDFLFARKEVYLLASLVSTSNVVYTSRVIFLIRRGSRSDRLRLVRKFPGASQ